MNMLKYLIKYKYKYKYKYFLLYLIMSLEDDFHKNLDINHKRCLARFNVENEFIEKLKNNISSDKIDKILSEVYIPNIDLSKYNSRDILLNRHPLFEVYIKDNILDLHINHCYIGGSILINLIETIIGSKCRYIPETNFLHGTLYGLFNIKFITNFCRNPINVKCNNQLSYYSKSSIIYKTRDCSRLAIAYYNLFQDTLVALNKDKITVGISVPFLKNHAYNNVGIIIFEYDKNTTIKMTENILKKNVNFAYTTNTYGLYCKKLSNIIGIKPFSNNEIAQ